MIRPYMQQIIDATNKCIKDIQRIWFKDLNTGRIKATRRKIKCHVSTH